MIWKLKIKLKFKEMKKLILIIVIVFSGMLFMTSCVTVDEMASRAGVSSSSLDQIPYKTTTIKVSSHKSAAELYDEIMKLTLAKGLNIIDHNDKYHYISTEGGFDMMRHKMNVAVTKIGSGSQAVFKTEWAASGDDMAVAMTGYSTNGMYNWSPATYWGHSDKPTYAIVITYSVANKIENSTITFEK